MTTALAGVLLLSACGSDQGSASISASTPPVLVTVSAPEQSTSVTLASQPSNSRDSPSSSSLISNLDLLLADTMRRNSDYEPALAIYQLGVQQGQPEMKRIALWGMIQVYLELNRTQEAIDSMIKLLREDLDRDTSLRVLYLLGISQAQMGLNVEARKSLRSYITEGGALIPYAHIQLAGLLVQIEDYGLAVRELEAGLESDLPFSVRLATLSSLADAHEGSGDLFSSLNIYQQVRQEAESSTDQARALWNTARLSLEVGDEASWRDSILTLVRGYPEQIFALDAVRVDDSPAEAFDRAVVLFRHYYNDKARLEFEEILLSRPESGITAQIHYYLGALAERSGEVGTALAMYESALVLAPFGPLAEEALWWRAQLLESIFNPYEEEVAVAYAELADRFPNSEHGREARFQAGLLRFRQGYYAEAIIHWGEFLDGLEQPPQLARGHYWLGRAENILANETLALMHFHKAIESSPSDYYALRARHFLEETETFGEWEAGLPPPVHPDWEEVENWLTEWAGTSSDTAVIDMFLDTRWSRGRELSKAGLSDAAAVEFLAIQEKITGDPWLLYRLTRAIQNLGEFDSSVRAAGSLVRMQAGAPGALLAVAYPMEFFSLIAEQAAESNISPLILLALIRQESLFDPNAISFANARGLTQIIPSTGEEIAITLGVSEFKVDDLFRPTVSVRFGSYYLSAQAERFNGDISAALAAYNGGAGNAERWLQAADADPDLFLESIDFVETYFYVQLVLEHYAHYQILFGLTEDPVLTLLRIDLN